MFEFARRRRREGVQDVSLLQHFQRARRREARAGMQQVAARNCLHGAASGARAGVALPAQLVWNAPARSVRSAASCALAACFLHGLCARAAARSRLIVSGVKDAWSDAAVHSILFARSDPPGKLCCLKHLRAVFVRARGCAKPSGVGWRSVSSWEVCRGPRHQWSRCAPHTWGVTSAFAGDANATVNIPHIAAAATASRPK